MHILSLLFSKSKGNEAQKIVLAGLLDLMRQTRHLIFGKQAFVWIFRLQIFWEFDAYAFLTQAAAAREGKQKRIYISQDRERGSGSPLPLSELLMVGFGGFFF
jgi:hypothetical protein